MKTAIDVFTPHVHAGESLGSCAVPGCSNEVGADDPWIAVHRAGKWRTFCPAAELGAYESIERMRSRKRPKTSALVDAAKAPGARLLCTPCSVRVAYLGCSVPAEAALDLTNEEETDGDQPQSA